MTDYMDLEQYAALRVRKPKGKRHQNSRKLVIDNIPFDSYAEAGRYQELKLEQRAGHIQKLEAHPKFVIQQRCQRWGKTLRQRTYTADFRYWSVDKQRYVVEDVKGSRRTKAGNIVPVVNEAFYLRFDRARLLYPELEFVIVLR